VAAVAAHGFTRVPITMQHAQVAADLPLHHRDPMNRFLIAQAIVEDLSIVTADRVLANYSARLLW
jgi:PIN domain nuclease of toxin-antitoxin system